MAQGRDIQLPNESGVIDPALAPHRLAQASNQRAYESRERLRLVPKPPAPKKSMARRVYEGVRALSGSR